MEEFDLLEADFQQFYNLDLESLHQKHFQRYARLFNNLPKEARIFTKYASAIQWTYDQEMLSQILLTMQNLTISYGNANRKKGVAAAKLLKSEDQFQPESVAKAKKLARKQEAERKKIAPDQEKAVREFWEKRNPGIKSAV